MKKRPVLFIITFICMIMFSHPVLAATKSNGNLNINMTYKLRDKTDYIQGNPFLCVYLYNKLNHYFVRLNYKDSKSTAVIKNPIVGTYQAEYYTAKNGKDEICKKAVKLNAVPDMNIFQKVIPNYEINKKSLYCGGTLNLSYGPSNVKVTKRSTQMKLIAIEAFDNVIPAYYIKVTGTKVHKIDGNFHLYLYESDSRGSKGKLLQDEKRKKNRYGYFRNMIVTSPGHYYYLISEKVPESTLTADKNVLMEFIVDYAGDRLCAKRVNITRSGKTRKIAISTDSSHHMNITVKDSENKNAEYLIYGPIEDTYPIENKDGTYNGRKKKMTKFGTAFSITMKPPVSNGSEWYSYNIVKKVNGIIEKGYAINIPFRWSRYKSGQMVTTWRIRPRVEFASVSSKK